MIETRIRTIARAVSYRLLALFATVAVVFVATGRVMLSLGVGLMELVAKLSLYYLHERLWVRVRWGTAPLQPPGPGERRPEGESWPAAAAGTGPLQVAPSDTPAGI